MQSTLFDSMLRRLFESLETALGPEKVALDPALLESYASDLTENPPHLPDVIIFPTTVEDIQAIVALAREFQVPVVPRIAALNVGGLAIPEHGGIAVDFSRMNRILEVNAAERYALIEPGVSWGQMKEFLDAKYPQFRLGYPLSPPETSIVANCLMDGLSNLGLRYGETGDWINGLEAVLPDGTMLRTGSAALSPIWFGRAPLPDLTGLFLDWQGTTGMVTKLALSLWPKRRLRKRLFIMTYDVEPSFTLLRDLAHTELFDDLGCLTWTTGKMLYGNPNPLYRDPLEPEFYVFADFSDDRDDIFRIKEKVLLEHVEAQRKRKFRLEPPLDLEDLVRLNPAFGKFADFPTRLDFLLDHPGGGLTWVGTYGPVSRWEEGYRAGEAILKKYGCPPFLVSRPMRTGHYGVLRFICLFDKNDPADIERMKALNLELVDAVTELGFVPYKTPAWAARHLEEKFDPGFKNLMGRIKGLLDPDGLFNPGKWPFKKPGSQI